MSHFFYFSYIILWLLAIIEGILLLLVYRHFGLIELGSAASTTRDGLHVGTLVLPVTGTTQQGEIVNWLPKTGQSYLLAFISATCAPCLAILPSLYQLAKTRTDIEIVLIVSGQQEAAQQLATQTSTPENVRLFSEMGGSVYQNYQVRVTPFAFVVGPDRRVRSKGLCDSSAKLMQLLADSTSHTIVSEEPASSRTMTAS